MDSSADDLNDPILNTSALALLAHPSCRNSSISVQQPLVEESADDLSVGTKASSEAGASWLNSHVILLEDSHVASKSISTPTSLVLRDTLACGSDATTTPLAHQRTSLQCSDIVPTKSEVITSIGTHGLGLLMPLSIFTMEVKNEDFPDNDKAQLRAALEAQMLDEQIRLQRLADLIQALKEDEIFVKEDDLLGEECRSAKTSMFQELRAQSILSSVSTSPQAVGLPPSQELKERSMQSSVSTPQQSIGLLTARLKRPASAARSSSSSPSRTLSSSSSVKHSRSKNMSTPRCSNSRYELYRSSFRRSPSVDRERPTTWRCLTPDTSSHLLSRSVVGFMGSSPRFPRQRDLVGPRHRRPAQDAHSKRAATPSTTGKDFLGELSSLLETLHSEVLQAVRTEKWTSVAAVCGKVKKQLAEAKASKVSGDGVGRTPPPQSAKMRPGVHDCFGGLHSHKRHVDGSRARLSKACGSKTLYGGTCQIRKDGSTFSLARDAGNASLTKDSSKSSLGTASLPIKHPQGNGVQDPEAAVAADGNEQAMGEFMNTIGILIAESTSEPLQVVLERISQRISHNSQSLDRTPIRNGQL